MFLAEWNNFNAWALKGMTVGNRDVNLSRVSEVQGLCACGQANRDARLRLHERLQAWPQPLSRKTRCAVHRQDLARGRKAHFRAGGLQCIEDSAQALEQPSPFWGDFDSSMASRTASGRILFELAHLMADRRRCEMEFVRGHAKLCSRAAASNARKRTKLGILRIGCSVGTPRPLHLSLSECRAKPPLR